MKMESRWSEDERVPRFCAFLTTVLFSASVLATLDFFEHDAAGVRVPKQVFAVGGRHLFST